MAAVSFVIRVKNHLVDLTKKEREQKKRDKEKERNSVGGKKTEDGDDRIGRRRNVPAQVATRVVAPRNRERIGVEEFGGRKSQNDVLFESCASL